MSLTYQPFAQVPEVASLAHDLHMNVPDPERIASGAAGMVLVAAALSHGGILRWPLLIAAVLLIRRGATGECALYRQLGMDRRHSLADR